MPGRIPDRWEDYSNLGSVIPGTRFICFKVPLDRTFTERLAAQELDMFTPDVLITTLKSHEQNLGKVIDLTNTFRYYKAAEFLRKDIQYTKVKTEGHFVPSQQVQQNFTKEVDAFLGEQSSGLLGIHCTHGVNRTGYLVCRYMIDHMGFDPEDAIKAFNEARGHKIERENYLKDLRGEKSEDDGSEQVETGATCTHGAEQQNGGRPQRDHWRSHGRDEDSRRGQGASPYDHDQAEAHHNGQWTRRKWQDDDRLESNWRKPYQQENQQRWNGRGSWQQNDRQRWNGRGSQQEENQQRWNGRGSWQQNDRQRWNGRGSYQQNDQQRWNGRGSWQQDDQQWANGRGSWQQNNQQRWNGRESRQQDNQQRWNGRGSFQQDNQQRWNGRGSWQQNNQY